ncbi:MAG: type II secretion system F family protein [Pseudomonadota bacterium]
MSPLPYQIRADLFHHLAAMEKAGLPPEQAFALLELPRSAQARLEAFRKLFTRRRDPAGAGLASTLFTPLEARLVKAAMTGGSPGATYRRLGEAYATKASQLAAIRSRMALPLAILCVALFVRPLPELFSGSLGGGAYLWHALRPLLLLAVLGALALRLPAWFLSGDVSPSRQALERVLLAFPMFGPMHARRNARDFIDNLAMLLEAGLPMFDAVPVALSTMNNSIVRAEFAAMLPAMKRGATLAEAIAPLAAIDAGRLAGFANTGEQSGTLPEMLARYAHGETEVLNRFQDNLAQWLPRLFYSAVSVWMAMQLLAPPPPPPL